MAKKLVFSLFFALPALAAPEFLPFGLAGVSKTQSRFLPLSRFPTTVVTSSTCSPADYAQMNICAQATQQATCGFVKTANCTWVAETFWDQTKCSNDGGACNCGTAPIQQCAAKNLDCEIDFVTKLDGNTCYTAAARFQPDVGPVLTSHPSVPGATPMPTSNPGLACDPAELRSKAQRCSHADSANGCQALPGCLWCLAEYPTTCQIMDEQCRDCEIAHEGVCASSELECVYSESVQQSGAQCYELEVGFRFGQCPVLSFEGPGIRNTSSPTPTPPPPSPLPPNDQLCTQSDLEHIVLACGNYTTAEGCNAAGASCSWCQVSSMNCELIGNKCSCDVQADSLCLATDRTCGYQFNSDVDGTTCGETDILFKENACPNVKYWTGGRK